MKQTVFMAVMTFIGTAGVLVGGPFVAIAVYYLFAVLRPQYLWDWALPTQVGWSWYVAWAAMFGAVGRLVAGAGSAGDERGAQRFVFGHLAFLAFALWIVVTFFTAGNQDVAWPWFIEYLKIFAMFGVAAIAVSEMRQLWVLFLVATFAIAYIAYEMNFLYLMSQRLDIYHRGYGGLDNNGAGLMLAMGIPLALYAWEAIERPWRWLFAATIPLLLHAVLMSYSRGAMIALLLASPIIVLRSRRRRQMIAMTVLLAALLPVLAGNEIRARLFTLQNYTEQSSANLRFASWQAALRIADTAPVFGVGIRNSNLLSFAYGADMEGRTIHSQYLQMLADTGYPGLVLYVLALGSAWVALLQARRTLKTRETPDAERMRSMLAGVEGALIVFCIGAAFLSLETFELPYLLALISVQSRAVTRQPIAHAESPR